MRRYFRVGVLILVVLSMVLSGEAGAAPAVGQVAWTAYLPAVPQTSPWYNFWGSESTTLLSPDGILLTHTLNLQEGWTRLNGRISWQALQPLQDDPIQWEQLQAFETELRLLKAAGIRPIVVVDDYPVWATDNTVRDDGQPTSCGRLRPEMDAVFAEFVRSLVSRYKADEFNVHNWELGNEPDVDPNVLGANSMFGCWGDIDDPYYGGERYGQMIQVVSPVIKAEDPGAQVWLGGLLLGTPNTTDPNLGHPEFFFEGVLRSGAAPYFDVLPFHWYPSWNELVHDHDIYGHPEWYLMGGGIRGKARFLRSVMQAYGVDKPLFLNETAFGCSEYWDYCNPPSDLFFDVQASYLVRTVVRSLDEDIKGYIWYTLNGPGWRYTGLLSKEYSPMPSYEAYQTLAQELDKMRFVGAVAYGDGIEAYAFRDARTEVHVIWAIDDQSYTIMVSQGRFVEARSRSGSVIEPVYVNPDVRLTVGFSPIYVRFSP